MDLRIGKYRFSSQEAYEAGLRDVGRIESLKEEGKTDAEQAKNFKAQIEKSGIVFESAIGRDFETKIDGILYANPLRTRRRTIYQVSDKKKHLKAGLTILFSSIAFVLFAAIVVSQAQLYRSEKLMKSLREEVAESTPTEGSADTDDSAGNGEGAEGTTEILSRYQVLASRNPDFAGWLKIEGTPIDYPVMYRSDDNDFYLSHNFDGVSDRNGLLVLDKRCSPDGSGINILIHGHNMRSGAMFGTLDSYEDEAYWKDHPVISFDTLYESRQYEICAVFLSSVSGDDSDAFKYYNYIDIVDEDTFNTYMENIKRCALYDTGVTAEYGDRLITLSTCEYSREDGRLVVVGREKQ